MNADRLIKAVNEVREAAREYHMLDEHEQTKIRAELYKRTGSFGKPFIAYMNEVFAKDQEITNKMRAKADAQASH
jgi:hypothetical protein